MRGYIYTSPLQVLLNYQKTESCDLRGADFAEAIADKLTLEQAIAEAKLTSRQRLFLWERLVNGHTVGDIEELYGVAHATISEHIIIAAKKLVQVYRKWERSET
ncbi:hypothetical protein E1Z16_10815 [Listeria monocytogenes]|uniref:Uncharacterized protein n=1 Tax=Listeria monocytogenes TaxID=1639 RepID=A0A9P2DI60_LISMN|nr:hypothetical protein [Listeria monocytogenes]ASH85339.1 hypothetical protein N882_2289 [Listeria monocytogenes serotype 1/2a str. 01-1468]EAA0328891.1 hypothetical protein [Listeria monocytogenes]EAC2321213.1 hypothetical protein [Listeria monocytogenes]EAC2535917.1 hypothetical protein [Listeria monocytogenes]EAC2738439.1 hypothetical protein [Listeria monocytogenes]